MTKSRVAETDVLTESFAKSWSRMSEGSWCMEESGSRYLDCRRRRA